MVSDIDSDIYTRDVDHTALANLASELSEVE